MILLRKLSGYIRLDRLLPSKTSCNRAMSSGDSPPITANYEATVATGIEALAEEEICDKLNVEKSSNQQGRVWFTTSEPVDKVMKLRTVNNLFLIIYDTRLTDDEMPTDKASLEELLLKIGPKCDWVTGLKKWCEVSKFKTDLETILTRDEHLRDMQPKFRVSSNRFGAEHNFTSQEISSAFGNAVDILYGWPIKMKDYDLEIMCNINENHLYVGLTLTNIALDKRNIIAVGLTTLRSATCHVLLRLAKIQPGEIVVDPMAGSGAIPVECCSLWNQEWNAYVIAGEMKLVPLSKSRTNLDLFKESPHDIMQLDVTSMPFREDSIDVFVCDLPFGRRHGSKRLNRSLYPKLVRDMARVARLGTGRAVLLTQDYQNLSLAYGKTRDYWCLKFSHFVKIGNLNCQIYLLERTAKRYVSDVIT